ncbi:uncharacterized protein LOC144411629 [Styela clava]
MSTMDPPKRKSSNWSEVDITNALQELEDGKALHRTAVKYGIPPSTLSDRHDRVKSGLYGKRKCWTEEDLENAIDELQQGKCKLKVIAQKYKIPEVTLRAKHRKFVSGIDIFQREKYVIKRKIWQENDVANALLEVEQGERLTPVARKYGIPQSTLYERFQKLRSKRNDSEIGKLEIEPLPSGLNLESEILAVAAKYGIKDEKLNKNNMKTTVIPPKTWTETDVFHALKEVSDGLHTSEAARKYGIPLTTLKRRRDALISGKALKLNSTSFDKEDRGSIFSNESKLDQSNNIPEIEIGDIGVSASKIPKMQGSTELEIPENLLEESNINHEDVTEATSVTPNSDSSVNNLNSGLTLPTNIIEKLKQSKFAKPRRTWSEKDLSNALSDLMDGELPSKTSAKYGIPLTTLKRRRDMLLSSQCSSLNNDVNLSPDKKNGVTKLSNGGRKSVDEKCKVLRMALLRSLELANCTDNILQCELFNNGNAHETTQENIEEESDCIEIPSISNDSNGLPITTNGSMLDKEQDCYYNDSESEIDNLSLPVAVETDSQINSETLTNIYSAALRQQTDENPIINTPLSVPNVISTNSADSLFFSLICLEMENLPRTKRQQFKQTVLKLLYDTIDSCE